MADDTTAIFARTVVGERVIDLELQHLYRHCCCCRRLRWQRRVTGKRKRDEATRMYAIVPAVCDGCVATQTGDTAAPADEQCNVLFTID